MKYAKPAAEIPEDLEGYRLIRPGELAALCGVTVGTVYRMVKAGTIPKPRRLSHRVSGWPKSEILPCINDRLTLSDQPPADPPKKKKAPRDRGGCIYFIRLPGRTSAVKIGKATDLTERLSTFNTLVHEGVVLLAATPGASSEKRVQELFRSERIRHRKEWFRCTPRLSRFIRRINRWCERVPASYRACNQAVKTQAATSP